MAIFEVENLTFSYSNSKINALSNVNVTVDKGEFVVIAGQTGSGKSTLLKLLKKQLSPKGTMTGNVRYNGVDITNLDDKMSSFDIGFVMQNPEEQIVTDKVWGELAFGLENMRADSQTIRRKVAEVSEFFDITSWYNMHTYELSGGQKQLLNLASIMVTEPKVLLLDEPTAQLDAIASREFINTLKRMNDELGLTIVMVEHNLDEVLSIADKVLYLDNGNVFASGTPREICGIISKDEKLSLGLPAMVKIFNQLEGEGECPLTVKEGKAFVEQYDDKYKAYAVKKDIEKRELAIECKGIFFRYNKNDCDILKGVDLKVYSGEMYCLLGGNGSGKTTLLNVISNISKAYRGTVAIRGKKVSSYKGNSLYHHNLARLPQNPIALFVTDSVEKDLRDICKILDMTDAESEARISEITLELEISHLLQANPLDLSGGELQKVAIAKIMLTEPKVILLDEPTKGLDAYAKVKLADILLRLKEKGTAILVVSHDIEFCAAFSDRCGMLFDGRIVSEDNPVQFFGQNMYYTTAAVRISRGIYDNAVTPDMVAELCRMNGKRDG